MKRSLQVVALPAGVLALALWAGPSVAQSPTAARGTTGAGTTTTPNGATISPGLSTTGAYTAPTTANNVAGYGYGYGMGSYGSVGYGYGMQALPTSYNPMAANTTGPNGYGYGVGNFGTTGYGPANNFTPGAGFTYGLSTTTAGPSGYGYGVGTYGTTGFGYGIGNYNQPGLQGRNPYPLGANTNTFGLNGPPRSSLGAGSNVTGTAGYNPSLYNPGTMGMNGIYATQYGAYGLATSTGTNSQMPGAAPSTSR